MSMNRLLVSRAASLPSAQPLTVSPQVLSLVVAVAVAGPLYSLRQLGLGHDLGLPAQPLPVVGPVASPGQLPHLVKR